MLLSLKKFPSFSKLNMFELEWGGCWRWAGGPTFSRPSAVWNYDCNPAQDLAEVSITAVICHAGMQHSFHIQVKLLFLSAPLITMWGAGLGGGGTVKVLQGGGGKLRERSLSRAPESRWRNLLWNTRSHYCCRDGFNPHPALLPPTSPQTHNKHTTNTQQTHTPFQRRNKRNTRETNKKSVFEERSGRTWWSKNVS